MGALWSGQKLADMSGSVTVPSEKKSNCAIVHTILALYDYSQTQIKVSQVCWFSWSYCKTFKIQEDTAI